MADSDLNISPVTILTADAIGIPGEREFFVRGGDAEQMVTLAVEKAQLQVIIESLESMLKDMHRRLPNLSEEMLEYAEESMRILPPVRAFFKVGQIDLLYAPDPDMLGMRFHRINFESEAPSNEPETVTFWGSRSQVCIFMDWSRKVLAQGRPAWPSDGSPIEEPGHFSKRNNGHKPQA